MLYSQVAEVDFTSLQRCPLHSRHPFTLSLRPRRRLLSRHEIHSHIFRARRAQIALFERHFSIIDFRGDWGQGVGVSGAHAGFGGARHLAYAFEGVVVLAVEANTAVTFLENFD